MSTGKTEIMQQTCGDLLFLLVAPHRKRLDHTRAAMPFATAHVIITLRPSDHE